MKSNTAVHHEVTLNNKTCAMTSKYLRTIPLNQVHHGDICMRPEEVNRLYQNYVRYQCGN